MFSKYALCSLFLLLPGCSCDKVKKEEKTVEKTFPAIKEIGYFEELKDHDKAIIKFHADWCGACTASKEPFAKLSEQYPNITFFTVNVDKEGDLKEKFSTQAIPTFILFEKGNKVDSFLGFDEDKLHEGLKKLLGEKVEKVISSEPTTETRIIKIKNKDDFQKAIKENKKVFVKFYGDFCGYCKMIAPDYEKLSQEFGDKVKFIEVEIGEAQDLAQENEIRGVPTFASFKNGKKNGSFSGANKEKLQTTIKELADED